MRPLKELLRKVKFKLFTSEYMRVAYLHPRSVVLVTVRHDNAENVLPLDWHIPLSFFPKLYGISLESGNYSSELIGKSGVFAVNFMPSEFEHEILAAGRTSGRNADKFALTNLSRGEGKALSVPVLNDAVGVLECKVVQTIETGDHTLFVGKVVREQFNRHAHQLFHVTRPGRTAGPGKPDAKGEV